MSDVPEEIWREILARLPVAPLLRLRCVSKSWKSLIDSDEFIKQHLDHSKKTNTKLSIILESIDLYSADFDLLKETNRATFQELPHPSKKPFVGGILILGLCDGLLALKYDAGDKTIIWNPSVRRFHEVPYTSIEFLGSVVDVDVNIVHGFGYDVVSNDYKIVRIVSYYEDLKGTVETEVKVYSLKFNSWRRVPDFPHCVKYILVNGEFVNGALHWIVTRKVKPDTPGTERFVAAFDLGTEEYRLIPLPKFASDDIYMTLVVLGGCLCLMCYFNEDHVDIWVMKEYGVQESWSILFGYDICHSAMNFTKPLAYSKCGRKVLLGLRLNDEVLMWYDLDKKSTDVPMVQMPLIHVYDMFTCLQSLVLLNNGACDFDLVANK